MKSVKIIAECLGVIVVLEALVFLISIFIIIINQYKNGKNSKKNKDQH